MTKPLMPNKQSVILRLSWIYINITFFITAGNNIHYNGMPTLTFKTCNFNDTFRLHSGVSLHDCVRVCQLRSSCQYAIYRHVNGVCALTESNVDIDSLEDSYPQCAYTKPRDWNLTEFGQCSTNPCSSTQICNPTETIEAQKCSQSACTPAPSIANASYYPSTTLTAIGLKVAYFCNPGYISSGNSSITCLENGTWSNTDFECEHACAQPFSLDNSDITVIHESDFGPYGVGSILGIECKPGFINNNPTPIATTCQSDLRWNISDVPCCKEGYHFSWHRHGLSCYILHEDLELETWDGLSPREIEFRQKLKENIRRVLKKNLDELEITVAMDLWVYLNCCLATEMVDFCKNESPNSTLYFNKKISKNLQVTEDIFQTTSSTLDYIMTRNKKSSMTNDLLKCIGKSEVQVGKHNEERIEHIKELITNQNPTINTTELAYEYLMNILEGMDAAIVASHNDFRFQDVAERLTLISGLNVSQFSDYDAIYEELSNQTIDKNDLKDETYTELAYIIRNNSGLVPECEDILDRWSQGHPNNEGDCIIFGPQSSFTLVDVPCNFTEAVEGAKVGFVCWEDKRRIQT